jgi:hypothetical protein
MSSVQIDNLMVGEKLVEEWECRVLDKLALHPSDDESGLLKFYIIIGGELKITQLCHRVCEDIRRYSEG